MKFYILFFLITMIRFSLSAADTIVVNGESFLNAAELESTIVFLEDSQRVKQTATQLRLLLDARKEITSEKIVTNEFLPLNLFATIKNIRSNLLNSLEKLQNELSLIPDRFLTLKDKAGSEENRERFISFLIMIVCSFLAGIVAFIILWNLGSRFRKIAETKAGFFKKMYGSVYLLLQKCSFWSAIFVSVLCVAFIPSGLLQGEILNELLTILACFTILLALNQLILTPTISEYRLLPITHQIAVKISKELVSLFRLSFVLMIMTSIVRVEWAQLALFLSGLYKVILVFWIPRLVFRFKDLYAAAISSVMNKLFFLPPAVSTMVKVVFSKLNIFISFFMVGILVVWLAGKTELYRFLISASIKTVIIVLISFLSFWLWGIIVNKIHKADIGLNPWCSSLKKYIDEHFLAFELGGFLVLLSGSIFVLMMTWGLNVQNVFRSDIPFVRTFTHVLSISLLTILIIQILRYVINKFKVGAESRMIQSGNSNALEVNKRVETLGSVVQKISISGIVLMAVIMIMDELGFDIKAMLAGVGILGLAVGFGAQNLVRDIISGLFLIFENRIRVGDVAIVNGTGGYVEQVNLRTSVLRGADGTVHVFPNGSISSLSNMTFEYSFYVFDIGVSYKENTDRVIEVLKGVGEKLLLDPLYKDAILEPMEIMGVDAFKDSAVIIKARIKTLPIKQWVVGREMNRRIKMRFEELGIEIPFPQQSINFSNTNKPLSLRFEGGLPQKDELKDLIREVLLEQDEEKHV